MVVYYVNSASEWNSLCTTITSTPLVSGDVVRIGTSFTFSTAPSVLPVGVGKLNGLGRTITLAFAGSSFGGFTTLSGGEICDLKVTVHMTGTANVILCSGTPHGTIRNISIAEEQPSVYGGTNTLTNMTVVKGVLADTTAASQTLTVSRVAVTKYNPGYFLPFNIATHTNYTLAMLTANSGGLVCVVGSGGTLNVSDCNIMLSMSQLPNSGNPVRSGAVCAYVGSSSTLNVQQCAILLNIEDNNTGSTTTPVSGVLGYSDSGATVSVAQCYVLFNRPCIDPATSTVTTAVIGQQVSGSTVQLSDCAVVGSTETYLCGTVAGTLTCKTCLLYNVNTYNDFNSITTHLPLVLFNSGNITLSQCFALAGTGVSGSGGGSSSGSVGTISTGTGAVSAMGLSTAIWMDETVNINRNFIPNLTIFRASPDNNGDWSKVSVNSFGTFKALLYPNNTIDTIELSSVGVFLSPVANKALGDGIINTVSATNLNGHSTYSLNTALTLPTIVITDVVGSSSTVTATFTASPTTGLTLSTNAVSGVTSLFSSGVLTVSGTVTNVNTALQSLTFTPDTGVTTTFAISETVQDSFSAALTGLRIISYTPNLRRLFTISNETDWETICSVVAAVPLVSTDVVRVLNSFTFTSTPTTLTLGPATFDGDANTLTLQFVATAFNGLFTLAGGVIKDAYFVHSMTGTVNSIVCAGSPYGTFQNLSFTGTNTTLVENGVLANSTAADQTTLCNRIAFTMPDESLFSLETTQLVYVQRGGLFNTVNGTVSVTNSDLMFNINQITSGGTSSNAGAVCASVSMGGSLTAQVCDIEVIIIDQTNGSVDVPIGAIAGYCDMNSTASISQCYVVFYRACASASTSTTKTALVGVQYGPLTSVTVTDCEVISTTQSNFYGYAQGGTLTMTNCGLYNSNGASQSAYPFIFAGDATTTLTRCFATSGTAVTGAGGITGTVGTISVGNGAVTAMGWNSSYWTDGASSGGTGFPAMPPYLKAMQNNSTGDWGPYAGSQTGNVCRYTDINNNDINLVLSQYRLTSVSSAATGNSLTNISMTATGTTGTYYYALNTAGSLGTIVVTNLAGNATPITVTLSLSTPSVGTLSTTPVVGVSSIFSSGILVLSGTLTNVNTALQSVTFTPGQNVNATFTVAIDIHDGISADVTGSWTVTFRTLYVVSTTTQWNNLCTFLASHPMIAGDVVRIDANLEFSAAPSVMPVGAGMLNGQANTITLTFVGSNFSGFMTLAGGTIKDLNVTCTITGSVNSILCSGTPYGTIENVAFTNTSNSNAAIQFGLISQYTADRQTLNLIRINTQIGSFFPNLSSNSSPFTIRRGGLVLSVGNLGEGRGGTLNVTNCQLYFFISPSDSGVFNQYELIGFVAQIAIGGFPDPVVINIDRCTGYLTIETDVIGNPNPNNSPFAMTVAQVQSSCVVNLTKGYYFVRRIHTTSPNSEFFTCVLGTIDSSSICNITDVIMQCNTQTYFLCNGSSNVTCTNCLLWNNNMASESAKSFFTNLQQSATLTNCYASDGTPMDFYGGSLPTISVGTGAVSAMGLNATIWQDAIVVFNTVNIPVMPPYIKSMVGNTGVHSVNDDWYLVVQSNGQGHFIPWSAPSRQYYTAVSALSAVSLHVTGDGLDEPYAYGTNLSETLTYTLNTFTTLPAIVISDEIANITSVTVTLTMSPTTGGVLGTGTVSGVTSDFVSGVLTVSGPIAGVNSALETLGFTPDHNETGNFEIDIVIHDGYGPDATGTWTLNYTNPTESTVSATGLGQTVYFNLNSPALIDDIVVSDTAGEDTVVIMTFTMNPTDSGELSVSGNANVISSFEDGVLTLTGPVENLNDVLYYFGYLPNHNNISNVTVDVNIHDGYGPDATGQILFEYSPPTQTTITANNINQTTNYVFNLEASIPSVAFTDAAGDATPVTAIFTLSSAAVGVLSVDPASGVTSEFVDGVLTVSGTVENVSLALLNGFKFMPNQNVTDDFTIDVSINNNLLGPPAVGTITMLYTAPTFPTISATHLQEMVNYSLNALTGLPAMVLESEAGNSVTCTVRLTMSDPSVGTLGVAVDVSGVSVSFVDGELTLTGTVTNVNMALQALTFMPSHNQTASFQIAINLHDGFGPDDDSGEWEFLYTPPLGGAVSITNLVEEYMYTLNTPVALSSITISNLGGDSTYITAYFTMTPSTGASLVTDEINGVVAEYVEGSYALSGTVSSVNLALETLRFVPDTGTTSNFSILINVRDNLGLDAQGMWTLTFVAPLDEVCFAQGTLITLANGTQVPVERLQPHNVLLDGLDKTKSRMVVAITKHKVHNYVRFPPFTMSPSQNQVLTLSNNHVIYDYSYGMWRGAKDCVHAQHFNIRGNEKPITMYHVQTCTWGMLIANGAICETFARAPEDIARRVVLLQKQRFIPECKKIHTKLIDRSV